VPITRQKSPVFSIVSLPTDSVIVDHAGFNSLANNDNVVVAVMALIIVIYATSE
jgi:hypothetical protein